MNKHWINRIKTIYLIIQPIINYYIVRILLIVILIRLIIVVAIITNLVY